jgi:thioredoxin reductase
MYDVIIVGAGPAGLSAALWLGRCRRSVLLCDTGQPRNAVSQAIHGFLTRDGIAPAEFLRLAREQLRQYSSVELRDLAVVSARREHDHFTVTLLDQSQVTTRVLLCTTGMVDELPPIEGIEAFYGTSVFHCPYCDGWEVRDQPLAIYGPGEPGKLLALQLTQWSADLVLCTDGPSGLESADLAMLSRLGILLREERIARLEGTNGHLERIVFSTGDTLPRKALFLDTQQHQHSELPTKLGYTFPSQRLILRQEEYEQASVPGLYVAGNAYRTMFVIQAAAEGAEAAFRITNALLQEDLAHKIQSV